MPTAERGRRFDDALAELSAAIDKLRIADEQLRSQGQELERARADATAHRELLELLPAGFVTTDKDGGIREMNGHAAAMLGHPSSPCEGKFLGAYIHQSHAKLFRERLTQCVERAHRQDWETWLVPDQSSSFLVVDLTAVPRADASGDVTSVRWLLQDRTAQRQAEAEARRLDEAMWLRVADRTAVLTGERESLRAEVERLNQRIRELQGSPAQPSRGTSTIR
jgi:PAS domain S-box-containing protein